MSIELPVVLRHGSRSSAHIRAEHPPSSPDTADVEEDHELEDADDGRTLRRVAWFVTAIMTVLLVQTFLIEAVRVRSDSMAPDIRDGDVLMVDKITYRFRDPQVNEVVVTEDPRTGETIVKRVVGVGGDSVGIEDGQLMLNGESVFDADIDNTNMDGYYHGPVVVPEGEVFLLGDNRDTSLDSRAFGAVSVDDVQGRVIGHAWPIGGH